MHQIKHRIKALTHLLDSMGDPSLERYGKGTAVADAEGVHEGMDHGPEVENLNRYPEEQDELVKQFKKAFKGY